MGSSTDTPFRICGACRYVWTEWRQLVLDPDLRLLGLQIAPQVPEANLILFEHRCGSTLSVLTRALRPHVPTAERDYQVLFGTELCNDHCRALADHSPCSNGCVNARDRALLRRIIELRGNPTESRVVGV